MQYNISISEFILKRQFESKETLLASTNSTVKTSGIYPEYMKNMSDLQRRLVEDYVDVNYGVMTGQFKSNPDDNNGPELDAQYSLIINTLSPMGSYDIPISHLHVIANLTDIVFLMPHKSNTQITPACISALAYFIKKICLMVPNPISVKFINPFITSTYINIISEVIDSFTEDNINLKDLILPTAYLWKCDDLCNTITSLKVKELTLIDTYVQPNVIYGLEPFYEVEFGSESDERKFNQKMNQYIEEIQELMREKTINLHLLPPQQCIGQIIDEKSRGRMELAYCQFNRYLIENLKTEYPHQFIQQLVDDNSNYFKPFDLRVDISELGEIIKNCPLILKSIRSLRIYENIGNVHDLELILVDDITSKLRTFNMIDKPTQDKHIDTYCNIIFNKDILPIYLTHIHSLHAINTAEGELIKIFEYDKQKKLKKYSLNNLSTVILCDISKASHSPFDDRNSNNYIILHSPYDIC